MAEYRFTAKMCVFCHQKLAVTPDTKMEELNLTGDAPFMAGSCPHCGGSNRLEGIKPEPEPPEPELDPPEA